MATTRVTAACNHSYQLTQDVRQFIQRAVAPAIAAHNADHSRPTRKRDRAVECVFTRIVTWLMSFEKLNSTHDMQAVGTGARCIFEHYLDLQWIAAFTDDAYLERFWAFPDVDRYQAAKKAVDHKRGRRNSKLKVDQYLRFMEKLDAQSERITDVVARLWGTTADGKPRWPKNHWTGEGNLLERAKMLGIECEDTYRQIYPTLCALVHPGATPFIGDLEWLEIQIGYGYFYAFHHAWRATELTIKLLGIEEKVPQLPAFRLNLMHWLEEAYGTYPPI